MNYRTLVTDNVTPISKTIDRLWVIDDKTTEINNEFKEKFFNLITLLEPYRLIVTF